MPFRRAIAILNNGSGSFRPDVESELRKIVSSLGPALVRCLQPSRVEAALREARDHADLVIVFGGDGTITLAASISGPDGPPLIALPGGTMNKLTRRLYGAHPWQVILRESLADSETITVGGGYADGHLFLVAGLFGVSSDWADAREALRKWDVVKALGLTSAGVERSMSGEVRYSCGDHVRGSAQAVAVRLAKIASGSESGMMGLQAVALDAASLPEALRLGAEILIGRWLGDPNVRVLETDHLTISQLGGVSTMLDGESLLLPADISVRFVPEAFRVVIPASRRRVLDRASS